MMGHLERRRCASSWVSGALPNGPEGALADALQELEAADHPDFIQRAETATGRGRSRRMRLPQFSQRMVPLACTCGGNGRWQHGQISRNDSGTFDPP